MISFVSLPSGRKRPGATFYSSIAFSLPWQADLPFVLLCGHLFLRFRLIFWPTGRLCATRLQVA